jgi:cytochrome P450
MTPDIATEPACPHAHRYPFGPANGLELDPTYAVLRDSEPLVRIRMEHGREGWLAIRHAEARTVMSDPRFSRAAVLTGDVPRSVPHIDESPDSILSMDPPEHGRLRRLVASAFTARRVAQLRPRIDEIATDLIESMVDRGAPAEFVDAVSMPLPVVVVCELLGVPLDGRPLFRAAADAALSNAQIAPEERAGAFRTLADYIGSLVAERRARPGGPGDDLLGALISARDEDDNRLTEAELIMLGVAILVGGHETTMNMSANMLTVLLSDRARWEHLVRDPSRIPAAVEELLRIIPVGVHAGAPRVATEDVELGGVVVRAGEAVLVSLAAANRDPAVFTNPEWLDLDREPGHHLAFGFGSHFCLGASLARAELQVLIERLVTLVPGLRLAGEVEWRTTSRVRGPLELPVAW